MTLLAPAATAADGFIAARLLERARLCPGSSSGLPSAARDALKRRSGARRGSLSKARSPRRRRYRPRRSRLRSDHDALFGAGSLRAAASMAKPRGDHQADQRLQADRGQRSCSSGRAVPSGIDGETWQDSRAIAVEASASVTLLPAEARPSPGARPHARRQRDPARRHWHSRSRAHRHRAENLRQCALAVWGHALPRPNAASHKYARWRPCLSCPGLGSPLAGAARLAARAAALRGGGWHCRRGEPATDAVCGSIPRICTSP